MLAPIDFNYQAPFDATKVGKVRTYSVLSAKIEASETLCSELALQFLLSGVEPALSRRPRSRGLSSSGFIIARLGRHADKGPLSAPTKAPVSPLIGGDAFESMPQRHDVRSRPTKPALPLLAESPGYEFGVEVFGKLLHFPIRDTEDLAIGIVIGTAGFGA